MDKSAYLLRISQANPVQLVVINLELLIEFLTNAVKTAGDSEPFLANIQKAKDGLQELIESLDFEIPLANDFYEIYRYVYQLITDAEFTRDQAAAEASLNEAIELMQTLLAGWQELESKIPDSPPVPGDGAPVVYSGLTYGRDGQAQEYIAEDEGRGFMA